MPCTFKVAGRSPEDHDLAGNIGKPGREKEFDRPLQTCVSFPYEQRRHAIVEIECSTLIPTTMLSRQSLDARDDFVFTRSHFTAARKLKEQVKRSRDGWNG